MDPDEPLLKPVANVWTYISAGGIIPTMILNGLICTIVLVSFLICCRPVLPLFNAQKKKKLLREYQQELKAMSGPRQQQQQQQQQQLSNSSGQQDNDDDDEENELEIERERELDEEDENDAESPTSVTSSSTKKMAIDAAKATSKKIGDIRKKSLDPSVGYWKHTGKFLCHLINVFFRGAVRRQDRERLTRKFGRELATYLLFQQQIIYALALSTALVLCILVPLYVTGTVPESYITHPEGGEGGDDGGEYLNRNDLLLLFTTIGMVENNPGKLYVTLFVGIWVVAFFLLFSVVLFLRNPLVSQFNYLGHDDHASIQDNQSMNRFQYEITRRVENKLVFGRSAKTDYFVHSLHPTIVLPYTALCTGVPLDLTSNEAFTQIVESIVGENHVQDIVKTTLVIDVSVRAKYENKLEVIDRALHHNYYLLKKTGKRPTKSILFQKIDGRPFVYQSVDAIDYYEQRKRRLCFKMKIWDQRYYTALDANIEHVPNGDRDILIVRNGSIDDAKDAVDEVASHNYLMNKKYVAQSTNREAPENENSDVPLSPNRFDLEVDTEVSASDQRFYEKQLKKKISIKGTGVGFVTFRTSVAMWHFLLRSKTRRSKIMFKSNTILPKTLSPSSIREHEEEGVQIVELPRTTMSSEDSANDDINEQSSPSSTTESKKEKKKKSALPWESNAQVQRSVDFLKRELLSVRLTTSTITWEPQDVNWGNLLRYYRISRLEPTLRRIVIIVILTIFLVFFSTPTSLASGVQSALEQGLLGQGAAFVKSITGPVGTTLFQYLPSLLLFLYSVMAPIIVIKLTELSNFMTHSRTKRTTMLRLFVFLLLGTVILPSLLLTSIDGVVNYFTSEQKMREAIENIFMPSSAVFFILFVMHQALLQNLGSFIRAFDMVMYVLGTRFGLAKLSAKERVEVSEQAPYNVYVEYSRIMSTMAVVILYSVFSPMVMVFGLLYIIVKHAIDRFNFESIYSYKLEVAGQHGEKFDFGRTTTGTKQDFASHFKLVLMLMEMLFVNLVIMMLYMCFFFGVRLAASLYYLPHVIISALVGFVLLFVGLMFNFTRTTLVQYALKRRAMRGEDGLDPNDPFVLRSYEPPYSFIQRIHDVVFRRGVEYEASTITNSPSSFSPVSTFHSKPTMDTKIPVSDARQ